MKALFYRLLHRQDGVAIVMVLGFMALALPMVTGVLSLGNTLSRDSQVKTTILKGQYTAQGCTQYAAWRLYNDPDYVDTLVDGINPPYNFDGCTITVNKFPPGSVATSEVAFADLVLVMDVSGSVDDDELVDMKQAANDIVDRFSLSTTEGRVRIGISRFRGSYALVQAMTDVDVHPTFQPLHDAINAVLQGGEDLDDGTNIVAGLQGGAATYATGLGDRVNPPDPFTAPNLMIFITDGNDSEGHGIDDIIAESAATGAEIFAIGVGNGVNNGTINAIASQPSNTHAFYTNNFASLLNIIDDIVAAVYGAADVGTLFIITSVSADGTISVFEVLLPP